MLTGSAYRSRLLGIGITASLGLAPSAQGQSLPSQTPVTQTPGSQLSSTLVNPQGPPATVAALPSSSKPTPACTKLDDYNIKGWATPYPSICDTLGRDIDGWRSKLASAGFGLQVISQAGMSYDLAQAAGGSYRGPQAYNGQQFTVQNATQIMTLTYNLNRFGLDGGQLAANAELGVNGYQKRNGPDTVRIDGLYWYQPILHKKVDLLVGYVQNQLDFIGFFVGGSLSSGTLGPQSVIPYQLGLSYGAFGAPTVSARIHWTKQFYTRTALQRSLSTAGTITENRYNPTGANFAVPGSGVLQITEIGYKQPSTPAAESLWVRGGGISNSSEYHDYQNGRKQTNWGLFALVDKQITQPDRSLPYRGLYVGASVNYAPPSTNLYTRYVEGRIYMLAPFASRPRDLASFVATYNAYSNYALRTVVPRGEGAYRETQTYIGSYAYHLLPGLFAQPGVGVVVHPTYAPKFGTGFNAYLSLIALL